MNLRRMQRSLRCFFKHGPFRCPHIERHSRRRTMRGHEGVEGSPPRAFSHPINIAPLPDPTSDPGLGPAGHPLSG